MAIIDKINIRGNQYDLRDNDAQAAIAPLYSTSATYAVGDYVMHDGAYYVCKTAIATPESWTAGHWMQTNVGAEAGGLKSAISQSIDVVIGNNVFPLISGENSYGGITWVTDAEAGTVIANGTASGNQIYIRPFTVPKTGEYSLTGCADGGSSTQWYMRINGVAGTDYGDGAVVQLSAGVGYNLWIVIVSGRTANNLVFKPSIIYNESTIMSVENTVKMLPYKPQTPPLFEGGISSATGLYYHDKNETWVHNRVRTNVVKIAKGARISTSGAYQLTICRYGDFELANFIETISSQSAMLSWVCPADGYYTITFKRTSGATLTIETVKTEWDFSDFYCEIDERIHIRWIGTGKLNETSTAVDVGDCTMVVFPNGDGILIDSGNARNYTSIRSRLAEAGFYHIKNIIITHFHTDHVGGLIQMVSSGYISIENATVYLPDYDATLWAYNNGVMESGTKTLYDNAMAMFANNNCQLVYPDTEFKPYEIGGAILSFFNTDLSVYENVSQNYNDWSLCCYIFYGNMNVCFTGDIGPIAQGHLGGTLYKSNIYKADHHGWLNQTTIPADYINNVSPDVIISEDGQTHDDLLQRDTAPLIRWAEKNGVPYYRKYQNNEIITAVSKENWMFENKVKRYFLPT